jgi:hypothetical protein
MTFGAATVRADSLTRATKQSAAAAVGNAVPMLQLRDNVQALLNGASKFGAAVDSVGVTGEDAGPGKAIYFAGDHNAFLTHAYVSAGTGFFDTGDIRRILFAGTPAYEARHSLRTTGGNVACAQCDSLGSYAASDTLVLWDRQYRTRIGQASTMVFAEAWGAGSAVDSLANLDATIANSATEGDLAIMLCALAHLDSLVRNDTTTVGGVLRRGTNARVLGDRVIKIAPVIYGGLSREQRTSWNWPKGQGINNSDTSAFYAGLDSIASLNIPVTFAVNVDSAGTYARDVIKLKSVPLARFTPQVLNGVADTSHVGVIGNNFYSPTDVFGR